VLRAPDWIKQALVAIAAQQLPAIADRVDLIDREEEIVPGIAAVAAPGHTPGHMAVAIKSGGDQLLHLVDTVLSPIHLEEPDWTSAVDYDPVQTAATRRKLLARAAREQLRVAVYHFPFPGLGCVVPYNGAWQWDPELLERE
jgi:glyoxylase-like metal-dependent hydrolase (beta-lactamase superfamily II)